MSKFRVIVESILYNNLLLESEQKVNWILSQPKLVQALESRIQNDSKAPDGITVEQLLKNFDNNSVAIGKFLPWVVKMYSNDEFEYTDLGLVNNYLENFIKNLNKLEKRDINQYKSLEELDSALENVKDVKGSRETKRDAKTGAEKIYEDNKWIILIPNTEEAAIQYGKGTKWCTAGVNDNMFNYYSKDGPLYILINKQNPSEKYQFHFETDQFKNVEDHEIDLRTFLKENPEIRKYFSSIKNFDKLNYKTWDWFDTEELTKQDYLAAVENDARALGYIPKNLIDREMCLAAIKNYEYALAFVPKNLIDREMCLIAVKKNGNVLELVPENLRNREMYLTAIKNKGSALRYVPENLRDREMCLEAVKKDGYALEYVPEKLIDYNICLEAVKKNGYALEYVPEKFKDKEMCLTAIKHSYGYGAAKYAPDKIKDEILKQELGLK